MQHQELSVLLQQGDFDALFRQMGWDNPEQRSPVNVAASVLRPVPAADKRGVTAWRVDCPTGLPKRSEQHRVVRHLKRLSRDQLVVFVTPDCHLWLWPEQRPSGVGFRLVGHEYRVQAPTDALLQRLSQATFKIDEETDLTSSAVLTRVRRSFNADKVAKSFYREFQQHHKNFAMKVKGVPAEQNCRWYASVLLNRLMFIYFIQQKGFLDNNQNYLRSRLQMVREHYGTDQFYKFYRQFLLPLFHEGLGSPNPSYDNADIQSIIGTVGELHRWMRQVGHDGRLLKSISNRWRFLVWHSGSVAMNVPGSRRCAPRGSALRRRLDGSAGTGPLCIASSTATAGTADTARRPRRPRRKLGR